MYYESFPRKVQRERSLRWTGLWRSVRKFDEAFGPKGRGGDFAADKKGGGWHRGQMRIAGFS
mgnify:FL=1